MDTYIGKELRESVPKGSMWSIKYDQPQFPIVLEDGRLAILYLSRIISGDVLHQGQRLGIRVYDAEENVYSKYSISELDIKYSQRG